MLRLESIKKITLRFRENVGVGADSYFWLEANNLGLSFYLLDCPLVEYRSHEGSGTRKATIECWKFTHGEILKFITGLNLGIQAGGLKKRFADGTAMAALGCSIIKLGRREISIKEFMEKEKEARALGVSMSFTRRVKWFLKYVLWKRWLGFQFP
jgi:hypothetical protein